MTQAGMRPDAWQERLLRSHAAQVLMLCSRQAGKSRTAGAMALLEALRWPGSLVLLLAPSERQATELFKAHLKALYDALKRPVPTVRETGTELELANGSRVIALPGQEANVRCYSAVRVLVVDEAARVPDELYHALRPMLAVSRGRLVALSSPFGKRGWFFEAYTGAGEWERVRIAAGECPRIDPAFLAQERQALGERAYRQEYECSFEDTEGSVFDPDDLGRAFTDGGNPLWR